MKLKQYSRKNEYPIDKRGRRIGKSATFTLDYHVLPHGVVTVHFTFERNEGGTIDPEVYVSVSATYIHDVTWHFIAYKSFDNFDPNRDFDMLNVSNRSKCRLSEIIRRFEKTHYALFHSYGNRPL